MNPLENFKNFVKNAFTPDLQGFLNYLAIDKIMKDDLSLFNSNLEHLINFPWVDNLVMQEAPQCRKAEWLTLDNKCKIKMVEEVRTSAYLWFENQ